MTITPSAQQQAIIDAIQTGKDIAVLAYAGTGKSTTLRMIAEAYPDTKFLYVVYNKSQQTEASRKMPTNVEVRTGDSLAWHFVDALYQRAGRSLADRKIGRDPRYLATSKDIAQRFNIPRYFVTQTIQPKTGPAFDKDRTLTVHQTISHLKKAIEKFCSSEDLEINMSHFNEKYVYPVEAVGHAKAIWENIKDFDGIMKIGFPHIAKLWGLAEPDISYSMKNSSVKYDVLMIDEAQDTNPVFGKVYREQKIQKIYVGDSYQSIYEFRGAGDELKKVKFDLQFPLTESYRFGPSLAEKANRALEQMKATEKIVGLGDEPDDFMPANWDVILCRTNAGVIKCIFKKLEDGQKINVPAAYASELNNLLDTIAWFWGYLPEKPKLHPDLEGYESKQELQEAIDDGDESQMVTEVLQLLESLGYNNMKLALSSLDARSKKDRVEITTAHKSKGSEWDNVYIWGDFRGPQEFPHLNLKVLPPLSELKLGYVAITRAKKHLHPGSLDYLVEEEKEHE